MDLSDVLIRRYNRQQRKDVVFLLKKNNLYDDYEDAANRFYLNATDDGNPTNHACFEQLLHEYLKPSIRLLSGSCRHIDNNSFFVPLLDIMSVLVVDAMDHSHITKTELCRTLKHAIHDSSPSITSESWIYYIIQNMVLHKISECGKSAVKPDNAEIVFPNIFIKWEKFPGDAKKQISFLTFLYDIMKLFKGVKTQATVGMLFNRNQSDYKIIMPLEHLCAFLCLFSLLQACKRISCCKSPGIYYLLKAHLKPLPNETLPQRKDYRKLKNEALADCHHKTLIMGKIKDLFEKYCPEKEHADIFYHFFLKEVSNNA